VRRTDLAQSDTDRVYDELLVILIRRGDRRAGELLAARWQPRLIRTARRLLNDKEQAREVVQETWSGICRGWIQLNDAAKFPAWAYGILHRKCADRIGKEARSRSRITPLDSAPEPATNSPSDTIIEIEQAFDLLSTDHRAAAILFFGEGLTLAEIATATGVPIGTAKSRLFHARRTLKAALSGETL
jgi:RNA polymerase sigma factor (sigma-70 family)